MSDDVFSKDFDPGDPLEELARLAQEPVPEDGLARHQQEQKLVAMARMAVPELVLQLRKLEALVICLEEQRAAMCDEIERFRSMTTIPE